MRTRGLSFAALLKEVVVVDGWVFHAQVALFRDAVVAAFEFFGEVVEKGRPVWRGGGLVLLVAAGIEAEVVAASVLREGEPGGGARTRL